MAGVGSMAEQVKLVGELRWRLFRNAVRSARGQLELAAQILLAALASIAALGIGLALGILTYVSFDSGKPRLLSIATWTIFSCWFFVPVLLTGMGIEFDFRSLLRFPLRFSAFVSLSLLYGLLDPPSVLAIFWTACMAMGAAWAQPAMTPAVLLVLLLFTMMNLTLNRAFLSWIERILARRRTREMFVGGFLVLLVCLQLFGALAMDRWEEALKPVFKKAVAFSVLLPGGAAGEATAGIVTADAARVAGFSGILLLYGLASGWLYRRRLRAQYRGEELGEGAAGARERLAVEEGWQLPGISNAASAMCEKEVRYAMRNGQTWITLVIPVVMVVFFSLAWSMPAVLPGVMSRRPEMFLPASIGYTLLIVSSLLLNIFAFESRGMQLLLTAPSRFQEVLLAKNLVHGAMLMTIAVLTWLVMSVLLVVPPIRLVAATFSGLILALLLQTIIGNAVSIYFPRQIEFGHFRKGPSGVNVLVGLAGHILVIGGAFVVGFLLQQWWGPGWEWVAALAYLLLGGLAFEMYRWSLDWCARAILRQREKLLNALAR